MRRLSKNDLVHFQFDSIDGWGVLHAVSSRHGGISQGPFSSLNLGHTVGDAPENVEENHQRLYEALGIRPASVVTAAQVHGSRVATVVRGDGGRVLGDTDALICGVPGLFLLLRFADCVPVFLYAPRQRAVGLAHAGWKGTLQGIAAKTARAMMNTYGCRPEELWAAIGPAIGPCCFEIGPEVRDSVRTAYADMYDEVVREQAGPSAHLDLPRLNLLQLRAVGVDEVEMADLCTMCHRDIFFSHRAGRGITGRFAAIIGLRDRAR